MDTRVTMTSETVASDTSVTMTSDTSNTSITMTSDTSITMTSDTDILVIVILVSLALAIRQLLFCDIITVIATPAMHYNFSQHHGY